MKTKIFLLIFITTALIIQSNAQLKVLSTGDVYIPGGHSYWINSSTDAGNRLRLHHNGSAAYIDFYPSLIFRSGTTGVISIGSSGMVQINANTVDWGSALKCVVPTINSCAYHLNYAGSDVFFVNANGYLWCKMGGYFGSDIKLKQNINKINSPLATVLKLNGIQFDYKGTVNESKSVSSQGQRLGFIAQDVEKILPGIVKDMPDSTKAISYSDLSALLVEAIKELQIQVEALKKQISGKDSSSLITTSAKTGFESAQSIALAYLEQNAPNPFSQTTAIKYYLPDAVQNAVLYIYDMNGIQLKNISISQKGKGNITINGSELRAGMFLYTLIADGKEVDTKRMILTN
jgi:hypothetical protein